ncbi:DUF664 domain-containing protein [Streptomyces sp. NPDC055952]|uniref:mycothiol transferase n=1 Tax=Streptomyces sp. NPDC055952 TaxID=3345663 RepID=UPI0035D811B5
MGRGAHSSPARRSWAMAVAAMVDHMIEESARHNGHADLIRDRRRHRRLRRLARFGPSLVTVGPGALVLSSGLGCRGCRTTSWPPRTAMSRGGTWR